MWNILASLIGGPIISGAINAYKAKLEAGNTQDRMAVELAERELAVQQAEREAQTKILIAEQGNWVTRSVRPLWSLPFIMFTWKVIVWDKLLGWGVTDPLDEKLWNVFMIMVAAYFGGRSAEKVATIVAGTFKRK